MHAFDILGEPVRRRILELLVDGERAAGELGAVVQAEFGISQPAVSQHLRVLRDNGFATVRAEGSRRLYALDAGPLRQVDEWLDPYRRFWTQRMDALATELARGKRARRAANPPSADQPATDQPATDQPAADQTAPDETVADPMTADPTPKGRKTS